MLNQFLTFWHMGGYGFFVWLSYGSTLALLGLQWFLPWRRWRLLLSKQVSKQVCKQAHTHE